MSIYFSSSRLSQVVMAHPGCLPVLQRFGINLGVGGRTIGEECARLGIDEEFFLLILNTYLNADYHPKEGASEMAGGSRDAYRLADYLEKTDEWYEQVQLPNIVRHFRPLLASGAGEGNLPLLGKFFEDFRLELLNRIEADRRRLLPALRGEGEAMTAATAGRLLDADFSIEEKISDLESFFVIHLEGNFNPNLCVAVVSAIFALGRDVRQNNRIRQRILRPVTRKTFGT